MKLHRLIASTIFLAVGLAAQAQGQQQSAGYKIKETYGDWVLRCEMVAEQEGPCHIAQQLSADGVRTIAEAQVIPILDGGAAVGGMTVLTPLETALQVPFQMHIDGRDPKAYPYRYCTPAGCIVSIGITALELNAMKKGEKALFTLRHIKDQDAPIVVKLSLTGFTDAFNALTQ